jgi:hypothetical protein
MTGRACFFAMPTVAARNVAACIHNEFNWRPDVFPDSAHAFLPRFLLEGSPPTRTANINDGRTASGKRRSTLPDCKFLGLKVKVRRPARRCDARG